MVGAGSEAVDASGEYDDEPDICGLLFGPGSTAETQAGVPEASGDVGGENGARYVGQDTSGSGCNEDADTFDGKDALLQAIRADLLRRMRGGEFEEDMDAVDDLAGASDHAQQPGELQRLVDDLLEPLWTCGVRAAA